MYSLTDPTTLIVSLAIFVGAALLHASLQLAVSVMTLLSGHALGRKKSHARLLHLCSSYVAGNITVVTLLILAATYVVGALFASFVTMWAILALIGMVTGFAVLLFYYRSKNQELWLPRDAAEYLYERSKKTKRGFEAFGLGMVTAIIELPFIAAPLLFVAMLLRGTPNVNNFGAGLLYALIACLPLITLLALIGSGRKVSQLQQWREQNRRFFQLITGAGLLVLSAYVFVLYCFTGTEVSIW